MTAMTLREKMLRALKPYLPRAEANAELAADAILSLLSDPANISDEMAQAGYEAYRAPLKGMHINSEPQLSMYRFGVAIAAAFQPHRRNRRNE